MTCSRSQGRTTDPGVCPSLYCSFARYYLPRQGPGSLGRVGGWWSGILASVHLSPDPDRLRCSQQAGRAPQHCGCRSASPAPSPTSSRVSAGLLRASWLWGRGLVYAEPFKAVGVPVACT